MRDLPPRARWYIIFVIALGAMTFVPARPARHVHADLAAHPPHPAVVAHLGVQGSVPDRQRLEHVGVVRRRHRGADPARAARDDDRRRRQRLEPDDAQSRRRRTRSTARCSTWRSWCSPSRRAGQVFSGSGGAHDRRSARRSSCRWRAWRSPTSSSTRIPIALAIALTTNQSAWRIWKTDFASSAPSYLLGAAAAAVVIAVTESSGYWLTLLLTAAPLYLTYKMYRGGRGERGAPGRDSRGGARCDHHDGSAAEHPRVQPGGRADVRLRAASTSSGATSSCCCRRPIGQQHVSALNEYMTTGRAARSPAVSSS